MHAVKHAIDYPSNFFDYMATILGLSVTDTAGTQIGSPSPLVLRALNRGEFTDLEGGKLHMVNDSVNGYGKPYRKPQVTIRCLVTFLISDGGFRFPPCVNSMFPFAPHQRP